MVMYLAGSFVETPDWVSKIHFIINEQYAQKLTLTSLSKEAGVHPAHLSRQFPKYFKQGLYYYVRKVKIEKAIELLKNRNHNLHDIAQQCGFSDPSHFNRCFRKIKGINPSAYRKIMR